MRVLYYALGVCLAFLLVSTSVLYAQGVTTSAMNGIVTDENGNPLPNANVIAVHQPSGTQYGISTRVNGNYDLLKMRPGGPYTVTISFVGYTPQSEENIILKLSQNLELNFKLLPTEVEISGVTVVGERSSILSGSRTGATQNVTSEDISKLPTINRQFQDFAKLSPQFSGINSSAGGRNNRYNNIQIDGTQHNDLFGLGATGAPGGQVNTAPISINAIQEFQVVIAPYDVRFGSFTGGGINAITKSGTNTFHGSAYGFGRNESFVGDAGFLDEDPEFAEFTEYAYGLNLGGPIIKDKMFFFLSGELLTHDQPITNLSLRTGDVTGNTAAANRLSDVLNNQYGLNPGGFGSLTSEQPSNKLFARIDWNISQDHTLTLRHNFVDADRDLLNNRNSSSRIAFETYNYRITSTTNSSALQLNSTFGNNMSNELIVGFTTIRDRRAGIGADMPEIEVDEGSLTLHVGPDRFSSANELDQDIFEVTDNFTFIAGDHALTVGTHNEFFSFRNLFIRSFFGYYTFDSIDDLVAGDPSFYQRVFSRTSDPQQAAEFSVNQFGFYLQDEWTVDPTFKVTAGVRLDIPMLPDAPEQNDSIPAHFTGESTTTVPDGNLLFSPRFGFNWDISENKDRSAQVRGGVGIFTGRIPYVWMSNNYGNTGTLYAEVRGSGTDLGFHTDPNNQPGVGDPGTGDPSFRSEVDLVDADFKFPQILRFNLGLDHQLPWGFVGTFEFLYSRAINDLIYEKINLRDPVGTIADDGRIRYGGTNSGNSNFFDVLKLKNTDEGREYSFSFQLQRQVARGLSINTAYSWGEARSQNDVLSSQARSQMRYNPIDDDPNNPGLTLSRFDPGHRIFASVSFTHEFFANAPTTISLFYNGQSGQRFSFTVDNDLNNDGFDANDLFYIPRNADDILLGSVSGGVYIPADAGEYAALFSFIENNEYLKENKGQMSKRNGARNPWRNILDMKIIQDLPTFGFGHVQLTLDILNVINLLDSKSGWNERTAQASYEIVDWTRAFDPATGRPVYSFNERDNNVPWDPDDLTSRWAMQFGVRWFF
ncbi:TonB-dependent receptor domain-containing protein [Bacteroidota bacterium]